MKNPIPILFVLLGAVFVFGWKSAGNCCVAPPATQNMHGLLIQDGTNFKAATAASNILFNPSGFEILDTFMRQDVRSELQSTVTYLENHPDRLLTIHGEYMSTEINESIYPNLGMARANAIKNELIGLGAPSNQLAVDGVLLDSIYMNSGQHLVGCATYEFAERPAENNRLAEVEARLRAHPLTLYFETSSSSLNLNEEQRQYFADLIYYLDNKEDAHVSTVGHTDNKGRRSYNVRLGQERADFVKQYLVKNGIPSTEIDSKSDGPDQPVATNNTETGRAENRRVVVAID